MPTCKSHRGGVKIHQARAHKTEKPQSFEGRLAVKAVQVSKLEELQKSRPSVYCGEQALDNIFIFLLYLGTVFAANGLQCYDVDARVVIYGDGKMRKTPSHFRLTTYIAKSQATIV